MKHEITAKELYHALKKHGQPNEATRYPGQRTLTKEDLALVPAVINAPDSIKVQQHIKNRASVIYSKNFDNGTVFYVERVIETSNKFEPRLTTKTIWVQGAETGVKSSSAMVYAPYRNTTLSPNSHQLSSENSQKNENNLEKNGIGLNKYQADGGQNLLFQLAGKKGAAELDRQESALRTEATTRLANLDIAREMETAGKDAKAVRLATGWERGADGKWRYEISDVEVRADRFTPELKELALV